MLINALSIYFSLSFSISLLLRSIELSALHLSSRWKRTFRRTFPSRYPLFRAVRSIMILAQNVTSEYSENRCTEMRTTYQSELNFVSRLAKSLVFVPALMPVVISPQITKADVLPR